MSKTHKGYALQLYIWNQIILYGIDGFALVNKLSLELFLWMNVGNNTERGGESVLSDQIKLFHFILRFIYATLIK